MGAEFSKLRSPGRDPVAAANSASCSDVLDNSGRSAEARCVNKFTGERTLSKALKAACAAPNAAP